MEPIGPFGINSLGHIAPIGPVDRIGPNGINIHIAQNGPMEPIGPIGINLLVHIAPNGPVEPIGPIGNNRINRANWADGTNWPNWQLFIEINRTNWAGGTNWPNWHK